MPPVLVDRQCSREMNEVGPLLSPVTKSEISNESDKEEKPSREPSNQACQPPILPTRGCSIAAASTASTPPWLLSTLTDLNEKMGLMSIDNPKQHDAGETFAQRAESYYRKRPQLLAFLQDLYRAYVSLSDRYVQLLSKNNHAHHSRQSSQASTITLDNGCSSSGNDYREDDLSDAESSLSFQQPLQSNCSPCRGLNFDVLVAEIVIKNVECDILLHEAEISGCGISNALRKVELQRSLLELLEAERLMLLNENARLGYRVGALIEENRELVAESMFVKRKVGELAWCSLKMREDQRVCQMSRKIEGLQGQIYRLERRNSEYHEQLVRRELEAEDSKRKKRGFKPMPSASVEEEKKVFGWWERVKKMDVFMCGITQMDHSC